MYPFSCLFLSVFVSFLAAVFAVGRLRSAKGQNAGIVRYRTIRYRSIGQIEKKCVGAAVAVLALAGAVFGGAQGAAAQVAYAGYAKNIAPGTFNQPSSVAVDSAGNLFVTNNGSPVGVYEVPAGCTTQSCMVSLGSGWNYPESVAIDSSGNIYVADLGLNAVEMLTKASGYSSKTALGGYFGQPTGVAVDKNGNIYVADENTYVISEFAPTCTSSSCVTNLGGGHYSYSSVVVDTSGNVYGTDYRNSVVRKMTPGCTGLSCTSTVYTGASGGQLDGITIDSSNNLYVTDARLGTAAKVPVGCTTTSCAVSLGTWYNHPLQPAVDGSGNVYIPDSYAAEVREVENSGSPNFASANVGSTVSDLYTAFFTFSGTTTLNSTTPAQLVTTGVANEDFIADTSLTSGACGYRAQYTYAAGTSCYVNVNFAPVAPGMRLGAAQLLNSSGSVIATALISGVGTSPLATYSPGTISTVVGNGQAGYSAGPSPATSGPMNLNGSYGMAVDAAGNLYIAESINGVVHKVTASTGVITTVAGSGQGINGTICSTATDGYGNGCPATSANMVPYSVALDGAGNLYIMDYYAAEIRKVDAATGVITAFASTGVQNNGGIAVDSNNNVYFADDYDSEIREVLASNGNIVTLAGTGTAGYSGDGGAATNAQINSPLCLTLDSQNNIYFADLGNGAVRKISNGIITTVLGGPGSNPYYNGGNVAATSVRLEYPGGLAVDPAGNVYIADFGLDYVMKVSASTGILSTIANYTEQFEGPQATGIDGSGNLYVVDGYANVVFEITATPAALSFATTALGATSSDSPQTVTVNNIGNTLLTFSTPATGTNPSIASGFSIGGSSTCPLLSTSSTGTLASGTSCTDLISFSPTVAGNVSGQLVTTDNSLNVTGSTQTVSLSGTGTYPTPTVTGLSPTSGSTAGGNTVTITGTGFTGATTVKFGTVAATSFTVGSGGTSITAVAPAHSAGSAYVTVSNPNSISASSVQYTYSTPAPTVTSISPSYGAAAGGGTITITGTGFISGASVKFGSTSATNVSVVSSTSITAKIPAGTPGSTVDVTVKTSNGTSATTSADQYTYQATQTITFAQPTSPVTYGVSPITLSATASSGLPVTFSITSGGAFGSLSGTNNSVLTITGVGSITIAANQAGNSSYAAATAVSRMLVVNQATQTISFTQPTTPVAYGVSPITLVATGGASGNPVTFSITSGGAYGTLSGTNNSVLTVTGVGTIVIAANQAGNANYTAATQVTKTLVVNQATQNINFTAPTSPVTYGVSQITLVATGGASGNPVTFSITSGSAYGSLSGTNNSVLTIKGAGTIVIAANQVGNTNYSAATQVTQTVIVNKAMLTAAIIGTPTKVYNGTTAATLTSTNYQLTGLVGTDSFTVTQTAGTYAAATAGTQTVTATLSASNFTTVSGSLSNYTLPTSASGSGTISPANASVTPNVATKVYGTADPTLTGVLTGFVASDNVTATYSRVTGSNVGSFTITATLSPTAVLANYNITYNTAQFSITPAPATVTANAASKTYGAANPTLTATVGGTVNGDTLNYTLTTTATTASGVGPYPITVNLGNNPNYTVTPTNGTLTVGQATATVTANAASKTYGTANPALTATVGGTVNGDTLSYTLTTTATTASGVGPYPITVNLGNNPNYTVTPTNGTLTVGQATATVTANPVSKIYGAANPAFTATVGGTVNGDTLSYTLTTTATTGSGVGPYPITVNLGSNPNYTVTATNGTLTVGQATATVMANPVSKTYGAANPTLTATVGGTVNGDTLNYTLTTTATTSSGVGPYPITVNLGNNPNYTVTPTNGTLTVNQATPSITVFAPGSITYGTTSLSLSGSLSWPGTATPTGAVTFLIDSTISVPGTCAVSGSCTATYNSASLSAGPHSLSVGIAADTNYTAANSSTIQLYVSKATPTITWATPAAITFGTALSATQLNSTPSVPGTLTYTPAAGAVLGAGIQPLKVSLTPSDTTDYTSASAQVLLSVNQAAQIITFTPVPTSPDTAGDSVVLSATGGPSGQPVVFSVLSGNATLANDGVMLLYTGAGTVVVAADQAASADGNYAAATEATATIVVNPASAAFNAGTVPVASQSNVLTATLNFPSGGTLGSLNYLTQGVPNLDFIGCTAGAQTKQPTNSKGGTPRQTTFSCPSSKSKDQTVIPVCSVGSVYSAGQICTVYYEFQPSAPGQRLGGITALDASGNLMGSSYITGTGTGPVAVLTPGTISTVAGTYYYGTASGDGGAATSAALKGPQDVTVDAAGNFYIADEAAQTIRKVTAATGIITTVAGNGSYGYSGDGGPATNASLQQPLQVAVDGLGNLYIADSINNRIREVTAATGIITTVAGSGPIGYNAGLSYLYGNSIGDGGPATSAILCYPTGIAVDGAGNLYISDFYNQSLRMVTAATGIITTVAGNGFYGYTGNGSPITGPLSRPNGLAVDGSGNVYVADIGKQAVWKVTPSTGTFTIVAGNNSSGNYTGDGGPATSAALDNPLGVAVDAAGNVYIADSGNQAVRKVTASTGIITTIVGTGNSGLSGDGGPANTALLNYPDNVALDGAGNLYIADRANARIREVAASSATDNFADTNVGSTSSDSPATVTVANNGYDPTSINPLTFSGVSTGTANFMLDSTNACSTSTSLEPGQTCALAVDFTPQLSGAPLTDAVTLADNNLNNITSTSSQQTVALSGNGLQQTPVVTVVPATITYGTPTVALSATVSFAGSTAPTGAVTFSIDGGAPVAASCIGTTSPLTCTATYPNSALQVVATHTITASIDATPGFLVSSGTNTLTVSPAAASVTPAPSSKIYGTTDPTLTGTLSGFLASDNVVASYSRVPGENVGSYTISATLSPTAVLSNYNITFNTAAFSITQATATVTANAASKTYGTANPTLTATVGGTVNGDTLNYTLTTTATTGSGVGPYPITVTLGSNPNYSITPTNGTLTVGQATATVTANPVTKSYGAANPTLTATVGGTVNGDTLSYTLSTTATTASGVGPYPITVTLGSNPNYTVTPTNGTLTVNQATATVTANAASKVYGTANPTLSATVVGTLNSDTLSYTLTTTATTASGVGPYPITVTLGSNPNYTVTPTNGTLTVNQATATVTANPVLKVYGTANPTLSATVGGTVNGDTLNYTLTTTATTASGVGPYPINVTLGSNPNYSVTPTNGTLTVTQATATVTANAATKTYGTANPAFTATVGGTVNGDTLNYTLTTTATTASGVGPYPITVTLGSNPNYSVTPTNGTLTITRLAASVTPNAATKVYGTADPTLTGTLSGFLPADGVTATYSRTSGSTVGSYTISATLSPTAVLANYNITSNTAAFTITQPTPVLIWANPSAITYGTALSATQLNATSNLSGGTFTYTPSAGTVLGAGSQTLSVLYTPSDTTDYTTASAQVTLTVNQATPVVTWPNPSSIVYGTATGVAQQTATANVPGSFFYTQPSGVVLKVGTYPLGVAFTPTDTTDYAPVSAYAYLTVIKATPTVTWAAPAAITYGTALSSAQLNATASVPGTFSYTPAAGTVLHAGAQTLSVTFTPTDTTDYNPVTTTVPLTVNQAAPVVTWANPPSIVYGTTTGAAQKTATATGVAGVSLPGSYFYTTPDGTVFTVGTHPLGLAFTPTDSTDYVSVSAYSTLTVNKATTTTTIAVTTSQTVTGTTATITATVHPQIGGTPTGTVTYYNGSTTLGSAAVGTPFTTGVLPVGTDQITAVYSGDSNFVGSSSSATAVTSLAPTTVTLTSPLGTVFYPASAVSFTVVVPLKNLQLIGGTITLYDGSTVIGTYSLPAGGILAGVTPQLGVGTHTLRAVYGGNSQYPPGQSPIVTVTVSAL